MPTATAPPTTRRWWVLAVLCLSVLLVSVDNTIVNVALPTIGRELAASTSDLQWVVDGYTLAFAALLLLGGAPRRPVRPPPGAAGRAWSPSPPPRCSPRWPTPPAQLVAARARDGRQRSGDLPGDAGPAGDDLHRAPGTGHRHRHLVGGHRPVRRDRTGHRRSAARALLLGLGLPGQPAAGRDRPRRRPAAPHRVRRPPAAPLRPGRRRRLRRRHRAAGLDDDRGARARLGLRRRRSAATWQRRSPWWPSSSGSSVAAIRCSTSGCSPTRGSRSAAGRSRWPSSASSGSSS